MSNTEFIAILGGIIGIIGGVGGIGGLIVAWKKLSKIAENQKTDILKVVLEIESQINERKAEFYKVNKQVMELDLSNPSKEQQKILSDYWEATRENYFNALDRLCFCIDKEYIPERDWKDEYRDMIIGTIKDYEKYFGAGSPYKNMLKINEKWR